MVIFLCWFLFSLYRCNFIVSLLLLLCTFISIFKRMLLVIGRHCIMNSSLSSKDIYVTRSWPIIRTNLFKSNSSLPVVDGEYSLRRTRHALASLITSIESLEPPSYWYNLLNNGKGRYANCSDLKIVFFNCVKKNVVLFIKETRQ